MNCYKLSPSVRKSVRNEMFPNWERWHTPVITEDIQRAKYLQKNSSFLLHSLTAGQRYLFNSSRHLVNF